MMAFFKKKLFILFLCALISGILSAHKALAAYDKNYVGDMTEYRASADDTFVYLARDYNLGYVEMRAANPSVDPWVPGAGTRLVLPTRHLLPDAPRKGIVINLPEMRLYHYLTPGAAPVNYPIGIGREGLDTPLGVTKVVRKVEGPIWTPTERMRREKPELPAFEPPGPNNPMGTHALYLGFPLVAIHGTNRAFGIGRRISSGCIRLYPEDIIDLYNHTPIGVQVNIVNQPIKAAWIGDELFIEAHPEVENAIALEETGTMPAPKLNQSDMERIIKTAGIYKDNIRWATVRTAIRERRGYPILIARKTGGPVVAEAEKSPENLKENPKEKIGVEAAAIPKKQIKKEAQAALKEITAEPYKPAASTAQSSYSKNHAAGLNQ